MQTKSLAKGAFILTVANIITRILGFVYRIYMSNVIGSEGIGLYQLIMPLYMLAWSISASGFSTTVSKLVAGENAKGQYGNMGRILKQSLLFTSAIALVLSIVLFLYTDVFAIHFIKDVRTLRPLKILSLCFPAMAASSCIRGYFFGLQSPHIPAVSQVFEQFVRMAVIYLLSASFVARGLDYACIAAVFGICAGEFLSFLYVFLCYLSFKKKQKFTKKPTMGVMACASAILAMAVPLTLNRVVGSLLATVENIIIPQRLAVFDSGQNVMSVYGKLTGMAMPLIQFPSSLLMALSITIVPAVSEATTIKNKKRIDYTISKSLLFTSITGIGTSCLFLIFPHEAGMLIYRDREIGSILFKLGLMCPLLYLQITLSGILNGLGYQVFLFRNNIISSTITICFVYFLIPKWGIDAFIVGWALSLAVTCILSLVKISASTNLSYDLKNYLCKPLFAGCIASLSVELITAPMIKTLPVVLSAIVLMYLIYFIVLMLTGCVIKEDIKILTRSVK